MCRFIEKYDILRSGFSFTGNGPHFVLLPLFFIHKPCKSLADFRGSLAEIWADREWCVEPCVVFVMEFIHNTKYLKPWWLFPRKEQLWCSGWYLSCHVLLGWGRNVESISIVAYNTRKDIKEELMTFSCWSMEEEWNASCLSLSLWFACTKLSVCSSEKQKYFWGVSSRKVVLFRKFNYPWQWYCNWQPLIIIAYYLYSTVFLYCSLLMYYSLLLSKICSVIPRVELETQ